MRVRAVWVPAISAGRATYGTWKQANAVAASRNAAPDQSAPGTPPGTANMSANVTGNAAAPIASSRVRRPVRTASRSLAAPTSGLSSTSQILGATSTTPATAAGTPSMSVR